MLAKRDVTDKSGHICPGDGGGVPALALCVPPWEQQEQAPAMAGGGGAGANAIVFVCYRIFGIDSGAAAGAAHASHQG